MHETETLRLDAGVPYRWRVGDIAVKTETRVCAECDDIHIAMTLRVDAEEGPGPAVRRAGRITLEPWGVHIDAGDALPQPVTVEHLAALVSKHREEVSGRGQLMLRSRDRELWRGEDLSGYQPGVLVRYRALFPADFDLIGFVDDKAYYLEDYHCVAFPCACARVSVVVTELDDDGGEHVELGPVSFELLTPRLKLSGDKRAAAIVRQVMAEKTMQRRIAERFHECRRIAPALAEKLGLHERQATVTRGQKVGRNDSCPCGSGKKYKKCCL